ncbi:MAG: DUF4212 domain-containing protein [Verrucomicrobiales bacterium]
MSDDPTPQPPARSHRDPKAYWRKNITAVMALLVVWFLVSYGCGILWVDELDKIRLGGFKLGFWFAQQGSIYVFIVLIGIYVLYMNKLDREFRGTSPKQDK